MFTSGEFTRLIAEDGLRGATSNPSIFEKAIAGSTDYLDALQAIERHGNLGRVGISLDDATDRLLEDGVTLFQKAFDSLLAAVDKGRRSEITSRRGRTRSGAA